jgi:hypothetical protein
MLDGGDDVSAGEGEADCPTTGVGETAALAPGCVQVTGLLPPWASQSPLLVVLHPAARTASRANNIGNGTRRRPVQYSMIIDPFPRSGHGT